MSDETVTHVSLQRAYQAALQTLSDIRSAGEDIPTALDAGVIKKLLTESFAFQFEEDQSLLEKRVVAILEEKVDSQRQGGAGA